MDHPSFGAAAIGLLLEDEGCRVGMLDCPDYEEDGSGWKRLPAPKLFVGVTAGTIDSMVTNRPGCQPLAQQHAGRFVVQYGPNPPAATSEVDRYYDLPFQRRWHPDHDAAGGIPALEPVKFPVNTHRGCMADCTFCSITFHQGRAIQSRSPESILRAAKALVGDDDFRGTITDVGGPTANMWGLGCKLLEAGKPCLDRDCLTAGVCPALRVDTESEGYRRLLAMVRQTEGVKNTHVSSGVRYDMLRGKDGKLSPLHKDLVEHHVLGQMKLAPEHFSPETLRTMNKPSFEVYEDYEADCAEIGRDQDLVNDFIVGHPGTTIKDAVHLFEKLIDRNYSPEQVQEFIPLPMTRACVQYVTGRDPVSGEEFYVPRGVRERRVQKALVRWKDRDNAPLIEEALREAGREDLLPRWRHLAKLAWAKAKASGAKKVSRPLELILQG